MKPAVKYILTRLIFMGIIFLAGCGGGGGGDSSSSGNNNGTTTPGTTTPIQGTLKLPSEDNPSDRAEVFNAYNAVIPTADGSFSISISETRPTFTYAISSSGNRVYATVATKAQGSLTIDAQSTAEAFVLLNPLLIPSSNEAYSNIINAVKSDDAVKSLASIIETIYGSVEDPLSDVRILDATKDAVKSVLNSLQISSSAQKALLPNSGQEIVKKGSFMGLLSPVSISSSLQIHNYDMAVLTLENSSGSTLKLEIATVGPGGIQTNVDWVAKIVELDPAKIQWVNNMVYLFNPDNLDNLIKANGYQQKVIVQGKIASGWLGLVTNPLGRISDLIGGVLFSKEDLILDHDGVYAVIALSGSPFGGDQGAEYNAIRISEWQRSQWIDALTLNTVLIALDVIKLALDFSGIDVSFATGEAFTLIRPAIASAVTGNLEIGYTFIGEQVRIAAGAMYDSLKPLLHSSISDIQSKGFKKLLHIAVNIFTIPIDVWSKTISIGTRAGNFLFSVTPREAAYVALGTPWPPTPPNTVLDTKPLASTTDTKATFTFHATKSGGIFECKLDSESYSSCISPKSYSNLAVGSHTFYVRATDAAGNPNLMPATYSWTITVNDPGAFTLTVGGTVAGITGSGFILQNNGGDNLVVNGAGAFTFATAIASGLGYNVSVFAQPSSPPQTCSVTNGAGTVTSANITNVSVNCVTNLGFVAQAYLKASNAEASDAFGWNVAVSGDTVAVAAHTEDSNQTTITNGTNASLDNSASHAGAVYIFRRTGVTWAQEAYLKASNADQYDFFGDSVAVSGDTVAVGALTESSNQTTITNGSTASPDNSASGAGAVYIFRRTGVTWTHEAYLKAPNAEASDRFGYSVAVSGDTVAVGGYAEDSNQTTITNGATASSDNSASSAGAVYIFVRP